MDIKKTLYSSAAALVSVAILVGCSDNDLAPLDETAIDFGQVEPAEPVAEPVADTQGACPTVGNLVPVEVATGECTIGGVLNQSATLSADMTWFLEDRLQVGNNEFAATLTVEAGTQIRGAGTDHLLVWPGSTIEANGTSANPVQMLPDNESLTTTAEWGGLFLRGFNGLPTLTGTQGANVLDYVVVAGAGAPVTVDIDGTSVTYQDNIVLNGVDSTTTMTFVQSHFSARDGFHILNGDPRSSWLLSTGATRDGVWYRDFTGLIKDLMVIHNPDEGRSGIYASETVEGDSNPRIVNATLVGRASTSVNASSDDSASQFGILFADNTDQIRMANVLIANFTNGCFQVNDGADLSQIDPNIPGPNYLDGVHCANNNGGNGGFGALSSSGVASLPAETLAPTNSPAGPDANGHVYYNGGSNPIVFSGALSDLSETFTANWYLNNIGGRTNGLLADPNALNGFLDGDTNNDGVLDASDNGSPFIIADNAFNADVADDTFGYDMTHVGASRSGNPANGSQFDGWTVATGVGEGFLVPFNP